MFLIGTREVLTLLAAGGPSEWLSGSRWPMHSALREIAIDAEGTSLSYKEIQTRPDPDVGYAVLGADAAVTQLVGAGFLVPHGDGLLAMWKVAEERLVATRRDLLRLPPDEVDLVYRAGRRWAALAATSLKNWRTAAASSGSTVASGTAKRRQVMLAGR